MTVQIAADPQTIRRCFPVMFELRPHLSDDRFVEQVQRQMRDGHYRLAYIESGGTVQCVAGFRMLESLAWGRFLYVDDLVTAPDARSKGYGDAMFDWLVAHARAHGCDQFHLDSGVQRFDAHRFYLRKRMAITSHHFGLRLDAE